MHIEAGDLRRYVGYVSPEYFRTLSIPEKAQVLQGNYLHAAKVLREWNLDRSHSLPMDGSRLWGYLITERNEFVDEVNKYPDLSEVESDEVYWWELPDYESRLKIAEEAADVMIFAGDILIDMGWEDDQIAHFWENSIQCENENGKMEEIMGYVAVARETCKRLGIDPASIIFEKTLANGQHYPSFLAMEENELRRFMRPIRANIGPNGSSIPPLVQDAWGETPRGRYGFHSIFGQNGFGPVPIQIDGDRVTISKFSDANETYGGLYRGLE